MQIMTGIEVNSEADFPKLREYCPSAKGMRAIFLQLRENPDRNQPWEWLRADVRFSLTNGQPPYPTSW